MSGNGFELLTKLFYSSGEGIMFFSNKGNILTMNPRAEEIFGYSENELSGKPVEVLVPMSVRGHHEKLRDGYIKSPAPRQMGVGRDLSGIRKDGTSFPLEISLSYIEHEDQKIAVAFITDISIRKENEKQLAEQRKKLEEYTTELERKVKARTSELEHMNLGLQSQIQERKIAEEALKQSLKDLKKAEQEILQSLEKEKELSELKSRFVSMASHEFRTPLTTVLSSANLITKYKEGEQQPTREKHVERIRKSVQNLTTILNDFLSIEKLESGAQKVVKEATDISELINDLIEELSPFLKKGQHIQFEDQKLAISTDQHILRNILINLISNASKYSGENDPIEIKTDKKSKEIIIQVIDHGIGIPIDEQKNMFERFFRAGNVTNIQGTGLGLTIVKKYLDLLEGNLTFASKEGQGATFTITLPL